MKSDYTVAFYIRLSLEDGDINPESDGLSERNTPTARPCIRAKEESNSISNQRDLLHNFIDQHSELSQCRIVEFCDDGYSGTNFERPGVKRLLEEAKQGKIQCIVVKDFSRFGRNYIEVGDYLEQLFPFLGIRFIGVNEHYDSIDFAGSTAGMDMAFKNLIYDLYSKDLSEKIKSGKKAKARQGQFINSIAFLGYAVSKQDKNKLVVDEKAAEIVRKIFSMKINGMSTTLIAKALNDENIPTPSLYKKQNEYERNWHKVNLKNHWNSNAVRLVLRDERYTGKAVFGKKRRVEVGRNKIGKTPIEDWIIVSNAHEAIVSEEEFEMAKANMKPFAQRKYFPPVRRPLLGKVKCGCCKHMMQKKSPDALDFFCPNRLYANMNACSKAHIREAIVEATVLSAVQSLIKVILDVDQFSKETKDSMDMKVSGVGGELKKIRLRLEKYKLLKIESYENYKDGKMTREAYIAKKDNESKQIEMLNNEISLLEIAEKESWKSSRPSNDFTECFKKYTNIDQLTGEVISEFVEVIYIYDEQSIEIVWKFADEFASFKEDMRIIENR